MTDSRARIATLVATLKLIDHPEGGRFGEVYRSDFAVGTGDDRRSRAAVTSIYYLLEAGQISRWHRVRSDEIWHFYEGEPLELLVAPPDLSSVERRRLAAPGEDCRPVSVVPAGWWQAAQPLGAYALVGCTVSPGFDYDDFSFLGDDAVALARLRSLAAPFQALV